MNASRETLMMNVESRKKENMNALHKKKNKESKKRKKKRMKEFHPSSFIHPSFFFILTE